MSAIPCTARCYSATRQGRHSATCEANRSAILELVSAAWEEGRRTGRVDLAAATARAEAAEAKVARIETLADEWEGWAERRSTTRIDAFRDAAEHLRAALADEGDTHE